MPHRFRLAVLMALFLGASAFVAADEEQDKPEYAVSHAECTFFSGQREAHLRAEAGLRSPDSGSQSLTEEIVAELASGSRAPSRSRSGALGETVQENYIDSYIFTLLRNLGAQPAPAGTDQEFLRRVTLDLTGRIPQADNAVRFLTDPRPRAVKRPELIDQLLDSPEWADRWAMFFGDLYRNTRTTVHVNRGQPGRDAFHYYLLDSLRENKPYNVMTREMIIAAGNNYDSGAVNFPLWGRTTGGPVQDTYDTQGVNVATVFLGMGHMDCITCHDGEGHLDSLSLWGTRAKRPEALGLAAFFARTDLIGNNNTPWTITDTTAANRNYQLNTTTGNRPARRAISGRTSLTPVYPFGGAVPRAGENWREALARFVTADFQFARATANYIWREFMVAGLVEPPDQFDPLRLNANVPPPSPWTLQPSNPALLDALARSLIRNEFNVKALMREIVSSRAYQLSARYDGNWNPAWERYYARKLVRRLRAEEIHDAVVVSSGVPGAYVIAGFREPRVDFAMQLPDVAGMPGGAGGQFLDSFLRGNRYDDDRRGDFTVLQALNLMNNTFVYNRTRNTADTLVNRVLSQPNNALVDLLYLHVLSRWPTSEERAAAVGDLASGVRAAKAEDLMFALYNKVDFIFNY